VSLLLPPISLLVEISYPIKSFFNRNSKSIELLVIYFGLVVAIADADVIGIVVVPMMFCVLVGSRVGGSEGMTEATAEPTAETPGTLLAALQPQSITAIIVTETVRTMSCFFIVFTLQVK
jgi:hypothetical protein